MRYDCVIFDMDGVITDSENLSYIIWKRIFAEAGYELTTAEYVEACGRSEADVMKLLRSEYPNLNVDGFFPKWEVEFEKSVKRGELVTKPGMYELLDFLDKGSVKRAVASSNTGRWARESLETVNIIDRMGPLAYGELVAECKPAPDLFLLAAKNTETEPSRCLVIEDSVAGIIAAKAAGMDSVFIPDMRKPTDCVKENATYIRESLLYVIDILKS